MSKRKKRLEKIRQNPTNVSFDEIRTLLEDYGVIVDRASGSHYLFEYTIGNETRALVIPFRRRVKLAYVNKAIKVIDAIIQERGDDN